jgi:hypothetical protein
MKCFHCKKIIKPKENYASLVSFSKGKAVHEDNWHAKCWREHWEEKMDKKVREYANTILNKSVPLIKSKFKGGNTPLIVG